MFNKKVTIEREINETNRYNDILEPKTDRSRKEFEMNGSEFSELEQR